MSPAGQVSTFTWTVPPSSQHVPLESVPSSESPPQDCAWLQPGILAISEPADTGAVGAWTGALCVTLGGGAGAVCVTLGAGVGGALTITGAEVLGLAFGATLAGLRAEAMPLAVMSATKPASPTRSQNFTGFVYLYLFMTLARWSCHGTRPARALAPSSVVLASCSCAWPSLPAPQRRALPCARVVSRALRPENRPPGGQPITTAGPL